MALDNNKWIKSLNIGYLTNRPTSFATSVLSLILITARAPLLTDSSRSRVRFQSDTRTNFWTNSKSKETEASQCSLKPSLCAILTTNRSISWTSSTLQVTSTSTMRLRGRWGAVRVLCCWLMRLKGFRRRPLRTISWLRRKNLRSLLCLTKSMQTVICRISKERPGKSWVSKGRSAKSVQKLDLTSNLCWQG